MDSETLAAYREGLLPRRTAGQVTAHLAHCTQCAALDTQLAELPALLARSPAPPMPAALTARIEAALAAEAAARPATADTAAAAGTAASTAARGHRRTPAPGPGRGWLALRAAAVAAAIVVLAGGGYGLSRLLAGGASGSSATTAPAAGRAAPKAAAPSGAHEANPASNAMARVRVVTSSTDYQPGRLQTQVRATLARFGLGTNRAAPAANPSTAAPPVNSTYLPACVQRAAENQRAELVDVAYYQGKPAAIIVIPGATANTLRVLVVGTSCSAAARGPIFSTLLPSPG